MARFQLTKGGFVAALLLWTCCQLSAGQVSLGFFGITTGVGTNPNNNLIFLQNLTGSTSDCTQATTFALACDNIDITNWSMEIDYTPFGGSPTQQFDNTGGTGPTISTNNTLFDPTLDGSLPYADSGGNGCCQNVVTKVIFTASLSPTQFTICDPSAGCGGGSSANESTFFALSPFTFTYIPGSGYSQGTGLGAGDAAPLLVNDIGSGPGPGPGPVPEPATLGLLIGGALAIAARRVFAH